MEEFIYIPEGCCQGKGRTDDKECCGEKQCDPEEDEKCDDEC